MEVLIILAALPASPSVGSVKDFPPCGTVDAQSIPICQEVEQKRENNGSPYPFGTPSLWRMRKSQRNG
jgi:hypothetical protein